MRKYLLHILLFMLLLLLSYVGYYAYMTHKTALPQADIYVWGDSRMYWALNPDLLAESLGKRVVTTPQRGAGPYDMMVFADRVPVHSTCIVGYSDCLLFRKHELDYNRAGCNWWALSKMALHTNYSFEMLYEMSKKDNWEPISMVTEPHGYYPNNDTVDLDEPWEGWYAMYKEQRPYCSGKGKCYEMAIEHLIKKECIVVLVDLPGYPEMERLAAQGSPNRHLSDSLRARILQEYALPVDTITIASDSLLYFDLSHLNERGSLLFTEQIANHINKSQFIQLKVIE